MIDRADSVQNLAHRCYETFKAAVADIAGEGRLRVGDVSSAAQTLWAACHGLVALRIGRPGVEWEADDTLMRVLLDSLFQGLAAD